jgi:predicted HTH transcriptional regulator
MRQEDINKRLSDVPLFKELSDKELEPFKKISFIRLCQSNGEQVGNLYQLTTQFTNREFANMIGTSRETDSRAINHLKKKNYINQCEAGFYLIDRDGLEQELFY